MPDSPQYPSINDREFDLLKKITTNTALIEAGEAGDVSSVNGRTGAVTLTSADVGLPNVDDTSDATKNAAAVTLTNKTISGASNTLTNIGNSSLTNSAITIGTTSVSLGGTTTTLAGLTSVTSTSFALGATTPGTISGASGAVTIAAAGTNQNVTITPSGTGYTLLTGTNVLRFGVTAAATIGVSADTTSADLRITNTSTGVTKISSGLSVDTLTLLNSGAGGGSYVGLAFWPHGTSSQQSYIRVYSNAGPNTAAEFHSGGTTLNLDKQAANTFSVVTGNGEGFRTNGTQTLFGTTTNNARDVVQVNGSIGVGVVGALARVTSGTGSPETVVTAPIGSIYLRTDGGTLTSLYVKESGTGNTGWVAK